MSFIQLPTDLHELVLFDTGLRRQRERALKAERIYAKKGQLSPKSCAKLAVEESISLGTSAR